MLYSFDHHDTETNQAEILAKRADAAVNRNQPLPPGEPTDEELMARVQRADEDALAILYRRHVPLLRTIVSRVINNDTDAEDLIQEIFCEVWRQAGHYSQDKGKALGWLVTLARRRAIDKLRKKQAYQRAEERLAAECENEPGEHLHRGVDQDAVAVDRAEILQRAISTLPEAQQEALKFAFYRGMSQREIAAHTGIPLGTIKTRIELAVRKIRAAILTQGGEAEWRNAA